MFSIWQQTNKAAIYCVDNKKGKEEEEESVFLLLSYRFS